MILITLGSQKFQFNRLLKAMDELVKGNMINDNVYAQIGYSDYKPQNYKYTNFLDREKFSETLKKADLVITHGGTGAIIASLKAGKKVIAVPRLARYSEHVDDHQLQLVNQFVEANLIYKCDNCLDLDKIIKKIKNHTFHSYVSNTNNIIKRIDEYIQYL